MRKALLYLCSTPQDVGLRGMFGSALRSGTAGAWHVSCGAATCSNATAIDTTVGKLMNVDGVRPGKGHICTSAARDLVQRCDVHVMCVMTPRSSFKSMTHVFRLRMTTRVPSRGYQRMLILAYQGAECSKPTGVGLIRAILTTACRISVLLFPAGFRASTLVRLVLPPAGGSRMRCRSDRAPSMAKLSPAAVLCGEAPGRELPAYR